MSIQILTRLSPRPDRQALALLPDATLPLARVHEACGSARRSFALWLAARTEGPLVWIAPAWQPERLNAEGLRDFTDPGRFLFVHPARTEDLLWTMEEVLRAGAAALAVADLPGPPGLTAIRRMHLAAETAQAETGAGGLGLLLTPGDGGAPGIETRWHMAPAHLGAGRRWRLERRRARTQPARIWTVGQKQAGALPEPTA